MAKKVLAIVKLRLALFLLLFLPTIAMSQLHTAFTATPLTGCAPMIINFTDNSTGDPDYWKWDFGNGTFGYGKSAVATYTDPGSYNVKLTIKNGRGIDSLIKLQYIVVNALPVVDFSASARSGCFPLKVNFSDLSAPGSGVLTAWEWDFGDGTVSNERNPVHTYTIDGNFRVILKVTNSNGCVQFRSRAGYIKLKNGVKTAFEYSSPSGCQTPANVNFINKSSGTGELNYKWDFGDGNTSQAVNPNNNYQNAGVYTVKLITTNSYGCADTLIKPNAINIGFVKSDFTMPDNPCPGTAIQLANTSNPSSYVTSQWDFGDGTFSSDPNPAKTYVNSGTYKIKLVTDFGSCKDSTVKSITVLPKPGADFTAINTNNCSAPLTVPFTNTTPNSVSYVWRFGDGDTATLANPEHTYLAVGSYKVTLIATNTYGCVDSAVKENFVNIIPPKIASITNLPVKGCIPLKVTPVPVFKDSTLKVDTYYWDFGDGSTSTEALPSHTYTTVGIFNVKLVITSNGCTDSLLIVSAVKAGIKPQAAFTADSRNICASRTVKFTDLSTGGKITEWLWNFGDGTTSIVQEPGHMYRDTGYFTVFLVATNYGCRDTLTKKKYIYVKPPVARFDTAYSCNTRLTREFIDKSIGATTIKWDLGGGLTFTDKKFSHTFDSAGSYPVALYTANGNCRDTLRRNVIVIKENGRLDINNPVSCLNTDINFTVSNVKPTNIKSYAWYFNGIAQPAAPVGVNPVTTRYPLSGTYQPAAAITDILNCRDTLYPSQAVKIYGAKADFKSLTSGTCVGDSVTFNDLTKTDGIHPVTNWLWNFGDSSLETFTNPPFVHQYNNEGKFRVSLVITDSYGCRDSISKPDSINIIKPVAKFIQSDTLICPNTTITFTNQTEGLNNKYQWEFGDGAVSDSISPLHTYTKEGKYKIKLVVNNLYGCRDSLISYINVITTSAGFLMSDTFINCPPMTVNLTSTSIGYSVLEWDFDDDAKSTLINPSHIFTEPGTYRIKLLARNNTGCTDTISKLLVVKGPKGTFSYTPLFACAPGKVEFTANVQTATKFLWNYQDGTIDSTSQNISSHIYQTEGHFLPQLTLEDSTGCRFAISGKDTIVSNSLTTDIIVDKNILCDSGPIHFSSNTVATETDVTYKWDFGDSTISYINNPDHTFTTPGNYKVTLQVATPGGCANFASMLIKVAKTTIPEIISQSSACSVDSISFRAKVSNDTSAITNWNWNFGNGTTFSSEFPPAQYYNTAGNYNASLTIINSDGCTSTVTKPIVVNAVPVLKVTPDTAICTGNTVVLSAAGADSYAWLSPDNTLSCTDCNNPIANPTSDVIYAVKGTSASGCFSVDSVFVKLAKPFNIAAVSDSNSICNGNSVRLTATGATNYLWSPAESLSSASISNPVAKPETTTTYQVIGYDEMACRNDTSFVTITVYNNPKVDIGPDRTITWRTSAVLTPSLSNDILRLRWEPATGLSCTDCATPKFMATNNISYKLIAENEHCVAEDEINILISYGNVKIMIPNAFSPNGDGINDVFYPTGVGAAFLKSFAIFNRWGTQIFAVSNVPGNDPEYGWKGTWKGKQAEVGVYYYIIEVMGDDNKITKYTGHITLLK